MNVDVDVVDLELMTSLYIFWGDNCFRGHDMMNSKLRCPGGLPQWGQPGVKRFFRNWVYCFLVTHTHMYWGCKSRGVQELMHALC